MIEHYEILESRFADLGFTTDIRAVSRHFKITVAYLKREIKDGRIPYVKAGGKTIYNRECIAEALRTISSQNTSSCNQLDNKSKHIGDSGSALGSPEQVDRKQVIEDAERLVAALCDCEPLETDLAVRTIRSLIEISQTKAVRP